MLGNRRGLRVLLAIVVAMGVVMAAGLATLGSAPTAGLVSRPPDTTWVGMDPAQCEWTPWEQEWWETHDGDFSSYPRDPEDVRGIIAEFFARRGISILDFDVEVFAEFAPAVCSSPRGHTFFLLVHDSDVDAMLGFGFRVVDR